MLQALWAVLLSLASLSKAQNNFIPPILITCTALPNIGEWNCLPSTQSGTPVQTGTECEFVCNGDVSDTIYKCGKRGAWNEDPNLVSCEGTTGASTATLTPSTTTVKETTTHTNRPPFSTTSRSTTTNPTITTTTITTTNTNRPPMSTTTLETSTMKTTTTAKTTNRPPISTTTLEATPSTTVETTTMSTTVPTTTGQFGNCPFDVGGGAHSSLCPETYCPAVFIESSGGAEASYPQLMGCYTYEGSLMGNEYPQYVNHEGIYLTPHAYSNPILAYTIWLVSENMLDTTGYIRNDKHDDVYCPYDMRDGWQYFDKQTQDWADDETLTVTCVHAP